MAGSCGGENENQLANREKPIMAIMQWLNVAMAYQLMKSLAGNNHNEA
jgi:hypothetical protein